MFTPTRSIPDAPQGLTHPDWSLLELEATDTRKVVVVNTLPDKQRWLAQPALMLVELGQLPSAHEDAMDLLSSVAKASNRMRELNQRLFGLTKALGQGSKKSGWWSRFTGVQLVRQASYNSMVAHVAQTREFCEQEIHTLRALRLALSTQVTLIRAECSVLNEQARIAGDLLANPPTAAQLLVSLGADQLTRLAKRLDNTHVMATSLGLTAAQCELTVSQAQSLEDRFEEIKSVLLPIWRQRLSLEDFGN